MSTKKMLSRRDFLRASALTAAGLVAAQCGAPATQAPSEATEAPAATKSAEATAFWALELALAVEIELPDDKRKLRHETRDLADFLVRQVRKEQRSSRAVPHARREKHAHSGQGIGYQ